MVISSHTEWNSSSSDKEKWQEINHRNRKTLCEQGKEYKEVMVELEVLPTKKAVADAINKGFEKAS